MMININKFDNQVEKIKNDAKNYEINVYQTLSVIKNMTQYWNDGYTKAFFRKVDQMLSGTNETTDFIYNIISYLKIISSDYNTTNYRRGRIFGYSDSTINLDHFIIYNGDDEEIANKKSIISNSIIENENHIESVVFKLCKPNTQKTSNTIEINPTNITEITTYDINNSYGNQMANPGQITDPNGPGGTNLEV